MEKLLMKVNESAVIRKFKSELKKLKLENRINIEFKFLAMMKTKNLPSKIDNNLVTGSGYQLALVPYLRRKMSEKNDNNKA